jgi:hypothetical protein
MIHANPGGIYLQTQQDLGAYCGDHHHRIFDVRAPMRHPCEFNRDDERHPLTFL